MSARKACITVASAAALAIMMPDRQENMKASRRPSFVIGSPAAPADWR